MSNSTQSCPAAVTSLYRQLPYQADPLAVYEQICAPNQPSLLLESSTIATRENLQSILLVHAALEFRCDNQRVTITALTANGQSLLPWLATQLHTLPCDLISHSNKQIVCEFTPPRNSLDEDSRLRAVSNIEPLRKILQGLEVIADRPHPMAVFMGGVFAYDYLATFEELPPVNMGENQCPDYLFYLAETLLIINHQQHTMELLGSLFHGSNQHQYAEHLERQLEHIAHRCQPSHHDGTTRAPLSTMPTQPIAVTPSATTYAQQVEQLQQHIRAGDIFQAVLARQFNLPCHSTLESYRELKRSNPSPYLFFLRSSAFELFGASPESALKYTAATNQVELYPIAGTRPRGCNADGQVNADLDSRIELELRLDLKETAEHVMLVDLARNDLARIAQPGTRHVVSLMQVDRYAHVMHLVSRVVAQLAPDLDALHAYRACMNMGTLMGAPKLSAARLIRQFEQQRRGSYGGALGYLTGAGDMDTCIVIRSAFVRHGHAIVQAGAGVVYASQPEAEVAETEHKAKAVINAIQHANQRLQEHAHALSHA